MKFTQIALFAAQAAAHATFQDLWVNGVDQAGSCVRLPLSNSPVTDVTSDNIRCNANSGPVAGKCAVTAGDTVTVEMHQQPGDRSCANEAIGGDHYGPVHVYMSQVADSSSAAADGSSGWFKIFADTWSKGTGSTDNWGTIDLNNGCGKMDLIIPKDIPAGDYLLRAEVIALHTASSIGGAQFYMSCYQITVGGGGSNSPATVLFPGAYSATDPGIEINIYTDLTSYTDPGPAVIASGSTRVAGSAAAVPGSVTGSSSTGSGAASSSAPQPTSVAATTLKTSTSAAKPTSSAPASGACVAKYGQCGGSGWQGSTTCCSGSTCTANGAYYSQCT